jgi:hypothetical protein
MSCSWAIAHLQLMAKTVKLIQIAEEPCFDCFFAPLILLN